LIYEDPSDPELAFEVETTYDDKYLIMMVASGTEANNLVYYADLTKPENREFKGKMHFTPLVDQWIGAFNYVQNDGTRFFFDTSFGAPRGKIVQIDLE
jgi:prolyl oligopeptidase